MSATLRLALAFSAPLNLCGAILFSPPGAPLRAWAGYPGARGFNRGPRPSWVPAFGVAHGRAAGPRRADRSLLALGAFGKGVFFALTVAMAVRGELSWLTVGGASPDLILAMVFAWALWRG